MLEWTGQGNGMHVILLSLDEFSFKCIPVQQRVLFGTGSRTSFVFGFGRLGSSGRGMSFDNDLEGFLLWLGTRSFQSLRCAHDEISSSRSCRDVHQSTVFSLGYRAHQCLSWKH